MTGESQTKAGARRAALYEAEKTYRSYHPSYRVESPFPEEFTDADGAQWKRVPAKDRDKMGDYFFTTPDGEEDSADIETMLTWDVRPAGARNGRRRLIRAARHPRAGASHDARAPACVRGRCFGRMASAASVSARAGGGAARPRRRRPRRAGRTRA